MRTEEKTDTYTVRVEPFHVDFAGNMFMGVLGNHLLNAAGNHSRRRGWGIDDLNQSSHTWVLSRLCVEMERMPRQYERVTVTTWVESVMRLFTNRCFAVRLEDGTPLGYARSVWAMIDLATRKPCDLLSLYDGDILRYAAGEDEAACPIAGHGRFRFRDPVLARTVDTYYSDVDINGHINSVKYIEHILDLFGADELGRRGVRRLEIAYKTEARMGDRLLLYRQEAGEGETDVEVRKNESEVVCQAKVCFR